MEVSVFGPGYGEAIVVHLGAGRWVLVDSCKDPISGSPSSLTYLRDLNVNPQDAVRLVVATHWHDDHVRGISAVLDECRPAKFSIPSALKTDQFLSLAVLYREHTAMTSSGLQEFTQVLQLLERRKQQGSRFASVAWASADRLLYRDQIPLGSDAVEARVFALSPADASLLQARLVFVQLLPSEKESKKRIAPPTPNHASVVLWIEVGDHRILLGADLQRTGDPKTGWSAILNDSVAVSGRADTFKIPHHGAENAHHDCVWSELLSSEPSAVVTPHRRGTSTLPSAEDIERIIDLTPHAYITAPPRWRRERWLESVVRDFVRQATRSMESVESGWGHVRLRQKIGESHKAYHVELYGDACELARL